jgi:hypothetical protein
MSGGGGGDGGYAQQQRETEAKKQAARDALNLQFGVFTGAEPVATDFSQGGARLSEALRNGGSAPTSYQEAHDQWAAQQATANTNKASRDALYNTVRTNAFDAGKRGLDEKRDTARRDLKFELFAKGLNGGSVDVDQSALLDRTYNQGVLDLGAKADAVRADMRNADEQTRLGLLQSIDAGMDQGTALSSALSQLSVNNDRAAATAAGTALGDLFADSAALYNASQARKGRSDAAQALTALFSTTPRAAGSGSSGIVSRVY